MFLTSIAKIYPVEVTVARHVHKYYHLFSLYIKKSLLFIAEFLEWFIIILSTKYLWLFIQNNFFSKCICLIDTCYGLKYSSCILPESKKYARHVLVKNHICSFTLKSISSWKHGKHKRLNKFLTELLFRVS